MNFPDMLWKTFTQVLSRNIQQLYQRIIPETRGMSAYPRISAYQHRKFIEIIGMAQTRRLPHTLWTSKFLQDNKWTNPELSPGTITGQTRAKYHISLSQRELITANTTNVIHPPYHQLFGNGIPWTPHYKLYHQ